MNVSVVCVNENNCNTDSWLRVYRNKWKNNQLNRCLNQKPKNQAYIRPAK